MRLLKKTLIAVGILVLLKIAEAVLSKFSPLTIYFHQSLLRSLQLLVLAWLVLSLLLALVFRKNPGRASRVALLSIVFLSLVFELLFGNWLQHPVQIPSALSPAFRDYYTFDYRKVVQVESSCTEYDSNFFYRLRPNIQCIFSNVEFSTPIETNSIGCRDDEASLSAPDIICIGDSYTMGWGVQQQENFPQQLEYATHMKVLNAGMSSFGTVRELRKLQTLDTSNCKWIILQYCDNDVEENKPFVDNNFNLKTSSAGSYDSLVKRYEWSHVYYPGKTFLSVENYWLKRAVKKFGRKGEDSMITVGNLKVSMQESIRLFIMTLSHFNISLQNRNLIVLYANEKEEPDDRFTTGLQQLLQTSPYKEMYGGRLFLLNSSAFIGRNERFLLDDHWTRLGHAKIADALRKIITEHSAATADSTLAGQPTAPPR